MSRLRLMRPALLLAVLGLAAAALLARPVLAQDPPPRAPGAPPAVARPVFDTGTTTIPFFPLGTSPLALSGPARPGMFVSAVGRRAIAMGSEDGPLELWSWPIKWLHDFELSFRIPKYTAPISGRSVAHSITERPEGITIEYAHEQFTVREHIFVPLDLPAVVILLEVDAIRPLDIIAQFTPDIHYAWPAGLGGQYLVWEQNARAFLFSEGQEQHQRLPRLTRRDASLRRAGAHARRRAAAAGARRGQRHRALHRAPPWRTAGTQCQPACRPTSRSCLPAARCRATPRWRSIAG